MSSWPEDDPGRADVGRISLLATGLGQVAGVAGTAQTRLVKLHEQLSGVDWSGEAATAFRDRIGKLPGHLGSLVKSYQDAADGFCRYAAELTEIQSQARVVQAQLSSAAAEHATATAAQRAYQPPTDPTTGLPVAGAVNPHDEAVAQAQAGLTRARAKLAALADRRRSADSAAAAAVHQAHQDGMQNASGWSHFWSHVSQDVSDWAGDAWHGIEDAGKFAGSVAEYYWENPALLARQLRDDLGLAVGILAMMAGAGIEAGGVVLDATGVGALVGVPANAAGIALMGGGAALFGGSALDSIRTGEQAFKGAEEEASSSQPEVVDEQAGTPGSWNKNLNQPEPNTTYRVDDRFTFKTDEHGRTTEAETTLQRDANGGARNGYQQRQAGQPDRLPGDQGGHIFGSQFGGPGEQINLTAMKGELNGPGADSYYEMESHWAKLTGEGHDIGVSVKIDYDGASQRPSMYEVTYRVDDGPPVVRIFDNE